MLKRMNGNHWGSNQLGICFIGVEGEIGRGEGKGEGVVEGRKGGEVGGSRRKRANGGKESARGRQGRAGREWV